MQKTASDLARKKKSLVLWSSVGNETNIITLTLLMGNYWPSLAAFSSTPNPFTPSPTEKVVSSTLSVCVHVIVPLTVVCQNQLTGLVHVVSHY